MRILLITQSRVFAYLRFKQVTDGTVNFAVVVPDWHLDIGLQPVRDIADVVAICLKFKTMDARLGCLQ